LAEIDGWTFVSSILGSGLVEVYSRSSDRPLLDSSGWGSGAGTGSLDWVPANEDGVFPNALIRIRRVKREKSSLVDMLASRDCRQRIERIKQSQQELMASCGHGLDWLQSEG
jgi:hypothetical protein